MRIVKKTLKGNLLGKTRVRSADTDRSRGPDPLAPASKVELPTRLKPKTQATLDALVKDDDVVIIPSSLKSRAGTPMPIGRPERELRNAEIRRDGIRTPTGGPAPASAPAPAPSPPVAKPKRGTPPAPPSVPQAPTLDGDSVANARTVLAHALFREFGEPGTELRQPRGSMFTIASARGDGAVRTQHLVTIPLPSGHVVSHEADVVVELDNKAVLMVDVVASHTPPEAIKARSFDALLLRRIERSFSVLVVVRTPGPGIHADQLEAIAHGYDMHFNIDAANVVLESKFAALRARITAWLQAAARPK